MFSRQSPVKRKHSEFHDPDYPQESSLADHDEHPASSSTSGFKKQKVDDCSADKELDERSLYLEKIKVIVEREFDRELAFKQQQLEIIGERIENAKDLLDKLRYAVVASYYKKQDLPLASIGSAALLRGGQTLFTREDKGPQMQIHPSIKKLIGKKPKNLSEVLRSIPKRTAAQNAVQTIRAKSEVQKREERKLKQIIRGQGIVIDHSIEKETKTDFANLLTAAKRSKNKTLETSTANEGKSTCKVGKVVSSKPLVGTRLNNKVKHSIVVGNTSKSIVGEQETDARNSSQTLTHKWLVYVQAKDAKVPIERYVKKIRYYLHHSYRPNDIVDVLSPPFHVTRRGWGEFPIRVQIFFHEEYHQKPVQMVHNVVLDKTMSGIQTLGAETLLEVWLRNVTSKEMSNYESATAPEAHGNSNAPQQPKQRVVSTSEELVDENLLEFLNKIEATHSSISADIEKIQPTVVVSEPLSVKTPSPVKLGNMHPTVNISPIKAYSPRGKIMNSSNLPTYPLNDIKIGPSNITNMKNAEQVVASEQQITDPPIISLPPSTINTPTHKTVENTRTIATKTITLSSFNTHSMATSSEAAVTKPKTTFIKLPQNSPYLKIINNANKTDSGTPLVPVTTPPFSSSQSTSTSYNKSVVINKDGKIIMPFNAVTSAVRRTILPLVSSNPTKTNNNTTATYAPSTTNTPKVVPFSSNAPKQILQKKLVQLVDASGKVKYMQMLVAASSTASTPPTTSIHRESATSSANTYGSLGPRAFPEISTTNSVTSARTTIIPQLKLSNGTSTSIMPAGINMKPNIFKIVPENMQTKPQIVTFCTVVAATSTTTTTPFTTTPSIQNVSRTTASNPTHVNVHHKSNCGTMPRNVVFQKEGKVYIIDPLQTKLKQQQKKQVSLLKPQVSLLKQQMLQQKQQLANHLTGMQQHASSTATGARNNVPQLHFGLKQQRLNSINALQLMQMKRVLFEKQILKQEFQNMRSAIEFILRRLSLVVPEESFASAFPFTSHSLAEFQSLTAFKQRAHEWLRAKQVAQLIRNHRDLQRVHANQKDTFWSTKEIAQFARQYGYTPAIKSLPKLVGSAEESRSTFHDIVKDELKQKQRIPNDTLTDHRALFKWIDKVWPILVDHEQFEVQNQIIDVDSLRDNVDEANGHKVKKRLSHLKLLGSASSYENYLSPPPRLENECSLVAELCRDLNVKLVPEELLPNVWQSSTQIVLAQCLQIFLQKVVRSTIPLKHQEANATLESSHLIRPADIAKVLSNAREFDFLTNLHVGSVTTAADTQMPSIKREKSS